MEALAPPQPQKPPLKIPSLPELRELFRLSASDEGLDLPSRKLAARITLLILVMDRRLRALEKGKAEGAHVQALEKSIEGLVQYLAPILQMAAPQTEEGGPAGKQDLSAEGPLPEGVPQTEDAPAAAPEASEVPAPLVEDPLPPVPPLQQPPVPQMAPQMAPPMPQVPQGLRGPPRVKQRGQGGRHSGGAGGGS